MSVESVEEKSDFPYEHLTFKIDRNKPIINCTRKKEREIAMQATNYCIESIICM